MFPSISTSTKEDADHVGISGPAVFLCEQTHCNGTPSARGAMGCDSTHCIIHLHIDQEFFHRQRQQRCNETHQWCDGQRDHRAAGAARNQATDDGVGQLGHTDHRGASAGHGISHASNASPCCCQQSGSGGMSHDEVVPGSDGKGRSGVEGQETHQQQEGSKKQLHRMSAATEWNEDLLLHWVLWNTVVLIAIFLSKDPTQGSSPSSILREASNARSADHGADQSTDSPHQMHRCRSCKVDKAHLLQPATAPNQTR
mmetsp:Transcript_13467/g.22170  ORF Transcript_13467/g.22170 Transcript_13467/m.22170 type:complete len:256 (+) Transcript_13467:909-1676(+)